MITEENRRDLETKGYTIVPDVLSTEECGTYQTEYQKWLSGFPEGEWPYTKFSLIQRYRVGHMQPTWEVRLKAYPVFTQLWKTKQLLSSTDAVAIGRPPEDGEEAFWSEGQSWIHCDQSACEKGLHSYQGAVYLETCDSDDWTFEVVERSHLHFEELNNMNQKLRIFKPTPAMMDWLLSQEGCKKVRVPCPKGGMVLWDSRLLHANSRPIEGRKNPGRWRFAVFVCMGPAAWATPRDLKLKAEAFTNLDTTGHKPSCNTIVFKSDPENNVKDPNLLEELPPAAKTPLARQLVGLDPYESGQDDGDDLPRPVYDFDTWKHCMSDTDRDMFGRSESQKD